MKLVHHQYWNSILWNRIHWNEKISTLKLQFCISRHFLEWGIHLQWINSQLVHPAGPVILPVHSMLYNMLYTLLYSMLYNLVKKEGDIAFYITEQARLKKVFENLIKTWNITCYITYDTFFSPTVFWLFHLFQNHFFTDPPSFFPISVNTALTKTLTYPSTPEGYALNATARVMTCPKLWNVMWGGREGVWENTPFVGKKWKSAGEKIYYHTSYILTHVI